MDNSVAYKNETINIVSAYRKAMGDLEKAKADAVALIAKVVEEGHFDLAFSVFLDLECFLDVYSDTAIYDDVLEDIIDRNGESMSRHREYEWLSFYDNEIRVYFKGEEPKEWMKGYMVSREAFENTMWAVMRSGTRGFIFDW